MSTLLRVFWCYFRNYLIPEGFFVGNIIAIVVWKEELKFGERLMMFSGIGAVVYAQTRLASLQLVAALRLFWNECSHLLFKFHFRNNDCGDVSLLPDVEQTIQPTGSVILSWVH